MRVFTSLDSGELERIAGSLKMDLYSFSDEGTRTRGVNAGKRAYRFLLRPTGERFRLARDDAYTRSGTRRIWAVSWAGHFVFMRAVLELDPDATIKTAVASYVGRDGFLERAWSTGGRNVGSMISPQDYRHAEAPGHAEWSGQDDLEAMALAAA